MSNKPLLTLYGRKDCHLCDEMIAALQRLPGIHDFLLEIVDIDSDPELEEMFGLKVPVLMANERELGHYFLDQAVLDAYFAEFR
ncbi:MAG: glutaredoxin family protein [Sulfuricellaceae bacterium]|nr:glutaredoxin family protein [Sulfuricellaceae bacterium]